MPAKRTHRGGICAIAVLMLGACWASTAQAAGAWLCRDEKGVSSYQDTPCPERKTSGIKPVKSNEVDEKAMRETMKRMSQAQAQRDSTAYLGLYSRSLKGTWQDLKGATGKSNYDGLERTINMVFDAANVAETYNCKVAVASAPQRGALQCAGVGNVVIAGRTIKGEYDKTFEFGIENGEVKIVAMKSVQTKDAEIKR